MYNAWAHKYQKGFTIVELLIVIVIIGILAAIIIVAYNGVQQRAHASAASADLSGAAKKLAVYAVDNGAYPIDLATGGITATSGTTFQYSYNNAVSPQTFCITGTNGLVSYKVTESSTPVSGGCAGHGVGGVSAVTNLITNPSVESDMVGWSPANSAVLTRQASSAIFGAYGVQAVAPANNLDSGPRFPAPAVVAGTTYTASASVRAITAGTYMLSVQGVGGSGGTKDSKTMAAGDTARFTLTWTPASSGAIAFYILRQMSQAGTHTFDVDGAMLITGSSNYADGNSPSWVWNGTTNNSTSTGPPQ